MREISAEAAADILTDRRVVSVEIAGSGLILHVEGGVQVKLSGKHFRCSTGQVAAQSTIETRS